MSGGSCADGGGAWTRAHEGEDAMVAVFSVDLAFMADLVEVGGVAVARILVLALELAERRHLRELREKRRLYVPVVVHDAIDDEIV